MLKWVGQLQHVTFCTYSWKTKTGLVMYFMEIPNLQEPTFFLLLNIYICVSPFSTI